MKTCFIVTIIQNETVAFVQQDGGFHHFPFCVSSALQKTATDRFLQVSKEPFL